MNVCHPTTVITSVLPSGQNVNLSFCSLWREPVTRWFKQFFIFLALKENVYSWFVLFGYVEKQTIIRTFSKQNGYN